MDEITIKCDVGEVSDGFHTFNELYEHRIILFVCLLNTYNHIGWKSHRNSDDELIEGWFVAGLYEGSITYHLPDRVWDLCDVKELNKGFWDGHTSNDVLKTLTNMATSLRDGIQQGG